MPLFDAADRGPADPALLLARAARYAAQQERCSGQLRQRLRHWGATADQIETVLARLVSERLVDDARYVGLYVRSKLRAGWGPAKIKAALRPWALPEAIIARALSEQHPSDAAPSPQILKALRQKAGSLAHLPPRDRLARLYRFALQRGFAAAEIRAALDVVLGPEAEPDAPQYLP